MTRIFEPEVIAEVGGRQTPEILQGLVKAEALTVEVDVTGRPCGRDPRQDTRPAFQHPF